MPAKKVKKVVVPVTPDPNKSYIEKIQDLIGEEFVATSTDSKGEVDAIEVIVLDSISIEADGVHFFDGDGGKWDTIAPVDKVGIDISKL